MEQVRIQDLGKDEISDDIRLEAIEYDMQLRMACLKLACEHFEQHTSDRIVTAAQKFYNFITNNEEIDNEESS
jgi:hypothetical protein